MATSNIPAPPEEAEAPQPSFECMPITDSKLKYINCNYKKESRKIYDGQCDVKLKVGDSNFKAHRDLLSEASDYFAAMFRSDMKEKKQDVIELKEITPLGITAMLEYFYHGYVTVDPENAGDILEAARFFHCDWMIEVCCDFLIRHLSLENYTGVITLADRFSLGDLRWDIFRFIGQNIQNLSEQPNFYKNLSLELLLQFLLENVYVEAPESFLVHVIMKWVKEDEAQRKEHLLSLLRQIRFGVMDLDELEELPKEVLEFKEMKDEVEEAKTYNFSIAAQCLKKEEKFLGRGAHAVGVFMSYNDESNLLVYKDVYHPGLFVEQLSHSALFVPYEFTSQAVIGNFLFVAGGYDEKYCSVARMFRFDPRFREWTELASMGGPRVSFALCSSDKNLFAIGGVDHTVSEGEVTHENETILDSCEMYNPEENMWLPLPSLIYPTHDQAAAFWDDILYTTGGVSTDPAELVPLNSTYSMPVGTAGWEPVASMLTQRQGHSMSAVNGKLYVIGGFTSAITSDFTDCFINEMFDVETRQWTEIRPTPDHFGHIHRHVGVLENRIYMVGGVPPNTFLHAYDMENDVTEEGEILGGNFQKVAILQVPYPYS